MDKISQISIDNTVSIKVDCILNQQILAKNFNIILNALNDLKNQQDKYSTQLKDIQNIKQSLEKIQSQQNNFLNDVNFLKNNQNGLNGKNNIGNTGTSDLLKQIQIIKNKINKHDQSINGNTKDINLLTKDMATVKDQIQSLKKMLNQIKNTQEKNGKDLNLSKNSNLDQQTIRNLNYEVQNAKKQLFKLQKQMENMNNKMADHHRQLQELKINQNNNYNNNQSNNESKQGNNQNNFDAQQVLRKLQHLQKKVQNLQEQTNHNTSNLNVLRSDTQKNGQDINVIHNQLKQINNILEQLQNIQNNDQGNLMGQIDKLKDQMNLLFKMMQKNKNNNRPDSSQNNKNIFERSFRIRSDSTSKDDINGKINQINSRLNYLQKIMGSRSNIQDPQKLPQIRNLKKDMNQTGYKDKSHKKQLNDLKHQLELWIKSYLMSQQPKGHDFNDLELKIQQIKNNLLKKADHQGMKKGLSFLQGKINQIFLFLTQPDSQDAMIVRKGFNCLSCSKKVQSLRGKLGPRMNWDLLNNTGYNNSPSKIGFPKYADSGQKDHHNNLI